MVFGYLVVALLAAAIVVFAFQNATQISVRFLVWTLPTASVAAVALVALGAGLVLAGIPLWIQRWRLRSRVRTLEAEVRQLSTSLADRERALLSSRPPRPPASP
jgi:uncharacterized integral membrane protein